MKFIGVMGCVQRLPDEFPMDLAENAGNMIHGNAPFELYDNCVYIKEDIRRFGYTNFSSFVNESCSHLIVTLANTLRLGSEDGAKYTRMLRFLESIKRPIVIFGLGVQAKNYDLESASLPAEAIELLKFLGSRCQVVGVRGPYTKLVVEKLSGIRNVMVVGCPSLFSRPEALARLRDVRPGGRPAYAGTNFSDARELAMFAESIRSDTFLIEPVNRHNHGFYLQVSATPGQAAGLPYFLKAIATTHPDVANPDRIAAYFRANYRLFRTTADWYRFVYETVSFTYGTRFHVNMASVLSGKPAIWITHDARTQELVSYLNLPSLTLEQAASLSVQEIQDSLDMTEFLDHLGGHFRNFNEYLRLNGLPVVKHSF